MIKSEVAGNPGRRVMRTETAAIVPVGIVQYELGDLGRCSFAGD